MPEEINILDIRSIGRIACHVQASLPRVRRALEELGITPAMRIDEVDFYRSTVVDDIYPVLYPDNGKSL